MKYTHPQALSITLEIFGGIPTHPLAILMSPCPVCVPGKYLRSRKLPSHDGPSIGPPVLADVLKVQREPDTNLVS